MTYTKPVRIKSISEFHRLRGLPQPEHPLISVVDYGKLEPAPGSFVFDYYTIKYGKEIYGQIEDNVVGNIG